MPFHRNVPVYAHRIEGAGSWSWSLSYTRASMVPTDILKVWGVVAFLLVGIYLLFVPHDAIRPYIECPEWSGYDYPCPIIQGWATMIGYGAFFGGLSGIVYYVYRTLKWRSDVREELRSQREPRIILSQEGSNFGEYHHFCSKGNYVGVWRPLLLGWINNAERQTRQCQHCGGEYMKVRNREDRCWYWVQPHDECDLFPKEQWEWYIDYRTEKRRQGWDCFPPKYLAPWPPDPG